MQSIIKILAIITLLLLAAGQAAITPAAEVVGWEAKVDPWVRQTAASGETEFLLHLRERADISSARQLKTKAEKGQFVYQQLSETAARSQAPLVTTCAAFGCCGTDAAGVPEFARIVGTAVRGGLALW